MARPTAIVPITADTTGINILVYGDNGSGKTPLAGSSPNCLIIDADRGTESAAMHGSTAQKWQVQTWSDMDEVYDYLRHDDHGFEWVWLDSGSLWQDLGLADIMEDLVAVKTHRSVYQPDKGEHGQNHSRMKTWTRHMAALPINFGMTALNWRGEDRATGEQQLGPQIRGTGMQETICGYFSVVAYLERSEKHPKNNILRTRPFDEHRLIRDRFHCLGEEGKLGKMINPTVPRIVEQINAARPQQATTKTKKKKKGTN